MSDEYRRQPPDALDEQEGEPAEPSGGPTDDRNRRHGAIDQDPSDAKDARPRPQSSSFASEDRDDR